MDLRIIISRIDFVLTIVINQRTFRNEFFGFPWLSSGGEVAGLELVESSG